MQGPGDRQAMDIRQRRGFVHVSGMNSVPKAAAGTSRATSCSDHPIKGVARIKTTGLAMTIPKAHAATLSATSPSGLPVTLLVLINASISFELMLTQSLLARSDRRHRASRPACGQRLVLNTVTVRSPSGPWECVPRHEAQNGPTGMKASGGSLKIGAARGRAGYVLRQHWRLGIIGT